VIAGVVPAVIGGLGRTGTGPAHQVVIYVGRDHQGIVTPVFAASSTPGRAIQTEPGPRRLLITPDGRTAYVVSWAESTVTPISTSTSTPGTPIKVGGNPYAIAILP
jgi:YVTN family beta-propeller protein